MRGEGSQRAEKDESYPWDLAKNLEHLSSLVIPHL